jgi:hypothetical protein
MSSSWSLKASETHGLVGREIAYTFSESATPSTLKQSVIMILARGNCISTYHVCGFETIVDCLTKVLTLVEVITISDEERYNVQVSL